MKIGLIGCGNMGINLALNAIANNHQIVGYDINKEKIDKNINK